MFTSHRAGAILSGLLLVLVSCDSPLSTESGPRGETFTEPGADTNTPAESGVDSRGRLNARLRSLMAKQAPRGGLSFYRLPESWELQRIPQDPRNPLTPARVHLGQLLYHETALSIDVMQSSAAEGHSCASCHFAQAGFQAGLPQGIAEGGSGFGVRGEARMLHGSYDCSSPDRLPDIQPIRSPATINAAYQELMLWNGQFGGVGLNIGTESSWTGPKASNHLGLQGLETQAHAGLAVHRMASVENSRVAQIPAYRSLFESAFPLEREPVNRLNAALAIAAFERTLLASRSPFQRWLRGEIGAMTVRQYQGAELFFGKAGCSACHTGPALNSMAFHALGMSDLDSAADPRVNLCPFGGTVPDDVRRGRGGFTGRPADDYAFKVPQLYNLTDSPHYGHGASFSTIREVVEYKNAGVAQNSAVPLEKLASRFRPLGLSAEEIDALVDFLEEALHDPDLMRFVPSALPSGNCTPDNDSQARLDLGCWTAAAGGH